MNASALKRTLVVLALGFSLTLPSLSLADHLHDNLKDEMSCEVCTMQSQVVTGDDVCQERIVREKTPQAKEPRRIPFETFRLGNRARGPPLH